MPQSITLNLSDELYHQLERTANLSHQPLENIVIQSLVSTLPPLLEEILPEYQAEVYPLLQMSNTALHREAMNVYPPNQWVEYESLLNQKKLRVLTPAEQNCLDRLRYQANVLTLRKGYATMLLKQRSYFCPVEES